MFTDRLAATLVHLRLGLPHAALAELYGVDRSTVSTVSAAIREVRPLLAARGLAIPGRPGLRVRTLDGLFAYADAEGVDIRLDGTEVQVRRPRAGRPGRRAFISGKEKQNTAMGVVLRGGVGIGCSPNRADRQRHWRYSPRTSLPFTLRTRNAVPSAEGHDEQYKSTLSQRK